ncbi:hypothetical protein BH11PSE14_BH11PSE14_01230 [soil metagenome]
MFAAACVLFARPASALPGFRALSADSPEQHSYEQGRSLALDLIRRARATLSRSDARLADAALPRLERAWFMASSNGASRDTCARGSYSLFVNVHEPGRIFVCDEVRPHARVGGADAIAILAQGFVHESAHLAGEDDECAATRFELAVMDRTIGRRSAGSRIRYGAQCNR